MFALLTGGDYATKGVPGCGASVAYGLAKCGFGDQLIHAVKNIDTDQNLEQFFIDWRASIRLELSTNSKGYLRRREPTLSSTISEEFPDLAVLRLYLDPLVSRQQDIHANWLLKVPSLPGLTRFCSQYLGWDNEDILKKKFKNLIWEGVLLQMIFSVSESDFIPKNLIHIVPYFKPLAMYDHSRRLIVTPNVQAQIMKAARQSRRGKYATMMGPEPQPKLVFSTANLVSSMNRNFNASKKDQLTVWPPEHLLPTLLQEYLHRTDRCLSKPEALDEASQQRGAAQWLKLLEGMENESMEVSGMEHTVMEAKARVHESAEVRSLGFLDLTGDSVDNSGSEHPGGIRWLGFFDLTGEPDAEQSVASSSKLASDETYIDLTMEADDADPEHPSNVQQLGFADLTGEQDAHQAVASSSKFDGACIDLTMD